MKSTIDSSNPQSFLPPMRLEGKPQRESNLLKTGLIFLIILFLVIVYYLGLRGVINFPKELVLGPFSIRLYALSLLTGIATVAYLFDREKRKYKELIRIDTLEALAVILVFAILGARLWHVATDFYLYKDNLLGVLLIWNGGLGIFGGMLGGLFGACLYSLYKKVDLLLGIALVSVFLPLGQVIGRFGNFFNQELYGPQTDLPWKMLIRENGNFHHPSFLYEQVGLLILFALMIFLYKKFGLRKEYVLLYLAGYSFTRFFVDFFRVEPRVLFGLTVAQVVSLGVIIFSSISLILLMKSNNLFQRLSTPFSRKRESIV